MYEIIINTEEIENVWEKDNLCFVKMRDGKVWVCAPHKILSVTGMIGCSMYTKDYIKENKGLICLPLAQNKKNSLED